MTKRAFPVAGLVAMALALLPAAGFSHCQVPCGIYDDAARIHHLLEDVTTIEKSMRLIDELSGKDDAQSANQLTRWIVTKEAHASNIITVVAEYFLTQKVKPVAAEDGGYDTYLQKLVAHHQVMSAAMQAKQNVDVKFVVALREAIVALAAHYAVDLHEH